MNRTEHANHCEIILGQAIVLLLEEEVNLTCSSLLLKLESLLKTTNEYCKVEAVHEAIAITAEAESHEKALQLQHN